MGCTAQWGSIEERQLMADKPSVKERIWKLGVKIAHSRPHAATESRVRLLLLIGALLTLYLGFKYNNDWYVEEFANYDWARDLGF